MYSIFISHSTLDKKFVNELATRLRSQGFSIWKDDTQIKVGQKISRRIKEGVLNSDYFLIVISKNSVQSKWVEDELDSAHFEAISNKQDTILPILIDNIPMPKELQNLKCANFSKGFKEGFHELMKVFEIDQDYIKLLPRLEKEKLIRKLLKTTDKWEEMPGEIITAVEDISYLPLFEENLDTTQNKQIVYNSVDAIKWLACYDFDHRIIRNHSSIKPLISLYKKSNNLILREKIIDALSEIGSKLCYDFLVENLKDSNPRLKATILDGLWNMHTSGDYFDWNPVLLETLHNYTTLIVNDCLYFDLEMEESDFRFWVFRCLSDAKNDTSIGYIEKYIESNTWPLETLAEAAAAHWHITNTTKYIDILKKAKGLGCSAKITLEEIYGNR